MWRDTNLVAALDLKDQRTVGRFASLRKENSWWEQKRVIHRSDRGFLTTLFRYLLGRSRTRDLLKFYVKEDILQPDGT